MAPRAESVYSRDPSSARACAPVAHGIGGSSRAILGRRQGDAGETLQGGRTRHVVGAVLQRHGSNGRAGLIRLCASDGMGAGPQSVRAGRASQ
jgi:hypothetical protein